MYFLHPSIERLAPDLILLECTNAIRRKVMFNTITSQEGDTAFDLLKDWRFGLMHLVPTVELLNQAYKLSKELQQHPIPDCLFLSLAEMNKCLLVTADSKFYNQVKSNISHAQHIAWIANAIQFP